LHKGRPYPFLHEFWATNFLFWPNFVGRRGLISSGQSRGDDWDTIPIAPAILTELGAPTPTFDEVKYNFTGAGIDPASYVRILNGGTGPGTDGIFEVFLLLLTGAYAKTRFPINFNSSMNGTGFAGVTIDQGGGFSSIGDPVIMLWEWATYAEGGDS